MGGTKAEGSTQCKNVEAEKEFTHGLGGVCTAILAPPEGRDLSLLSESKGSCNADNAPK